jgi:signal peptidase II
MFPAKNPTRFFLFAILLIGIDQLSKQLVHNFMHQGPGGEVHIIGDWFKLHYITNEGMAFGMKLEHPYGKIFLTVFRLIATGFLGYYIVHLARHGAKCGLLWAMSMIFAGAIGNVIDSIFYGVLLGNAPFGSLSPWFHGQVIDMIFFDFWEGYMPDWIPVWGGKYFSMPIFNFADSCIFIGVCIILIFQGSFFPRLHEDESDEEMSNMSDKTTLTDGTLPTTEPEF